MNLPANLAKDGANPVFLSLSRQEIESEDALRQSFDQVARRVCGGVVLPLGLDETSWATTRAALQKCGEIGLKVWLRIEYSNQGAPYAAYRAHDVAAGFVPRENDATLALTIVPRLANGELVWPRAQTYARQTHAKRTETQNTTTQKAETKEAETETSQTRAPVEFDARVYDWRQEHDATRAFDPLDRSAVEAVISSTRNAWQSVVTPALRDVVAGVSVEVPCLWDEDAPDANQRFPWSHELPLRFRSLHGGDLTEQLSSLVADTGIEAVRVRQQFWQSVATLLHENFAQSWENWAQEIGARLQWRFRAANLNRLVARYGAIVTLTQGTTDVVVEIESDEIESDAKQDLKNDAKSVVENALKKETRHSSNTILVRLLASIFALKAGDESDAARVTVAFPNTASLFEWHRYLLAGATRFEVSLERTQQNESVSHAQLLHPYLARQVEVLRGGQSGARVGVVWPMRSAQSHHHPKGHRFVRWVEEDVADVADWLDDLRFDWLFLTEDAIQNATIEDRVLDVRQRARPTSILQVGAGALEAIVLPSVTCLSRATWAKLEEFAVRGGKIICLGLLPRWSEIGRDEEQERHLETQTRCTIEDIYEAYRREGTELSELQMLAPSSVGFPILRQTASGGRIATYQPRLNLDRDDARLRVRPIFTESVSPDIETQARDFLYTRRVAPNGSLFWLWNRRAETAKINLVLRPGQCLSVEERDAWNGTSTRCPLWMNLPIEEGGGLALTLQMAPGETRLLVIATKPQNIEDDAPDVAAPDLDSPNGALSQGQLSQRLPPIQMHGESANFAVESFDGVVARGHATQSGEPMIAVRQKGRLVWWRGAEVVVPAPLLLDDWDVEPFVSAWGETQIEYSKTVRVPAAWRDCQVRLEIAVSTLNRPENVAEAWTNGQFLGRRFAPPLSFDFALPAADGEDEEEISLELTLRLEPPRETDIWEPPLARLVAYPRVEIRRPNE